MITSRQKQLLAIVVQEYTDTALPVSSRVLVKKYKIPFSPATLRAELARLCDTGYLVQPHTSAGRIPTDKGYRFYIKNLMKPHGLSREEQTRIKKSLVKEKPSRGKVIAKTISLNSNNVGLYIDSDEEMVYKEGLSDLFQSPDFHERDDVLEMIRLLDDLDRHMETLFELVDRMWRIDECLDRNLMICYNVLF